MSNMDFGESTIGSNGFYQGNESVDKLLERINLIQEQYLSLWDIPDEAHFFISHELAALKHLLSRQGTPCEQGSERTAELAFYASTHLNCAYSRLRMELQLLDLEWTDQARGLATDAA